MSKQIIPVPDLGGASEVEVIEICVAVDDVVGAEQSLVVVESDKASMDIPCPAAGSIGAILVSVGDSVSEGQALVELVTDAEAGAPIADAPEVADNTVENADTDAAATEQVDGGDAAAKTSPEAESSEQTVQVPDLGGAEKVEVIELLVAVGDSVAEGDGLLVMESDKASMDMPAPFSGTVVALHVAPGDSVGEGDAVAVLTVDASGAPVSSTSTGMESAPAAASTSAPKANAVAGVASIESKKDPSARKDSGERRRKTDIYAGPAVRKLARELGVDLRKVTGTGPRGRIAKADLVAFVKKAVQEPSSVGHGLPRIPDVDFSQFGEIDIQPMSKLHKITAANMQRSWLNVPHVTQFDEADITELEAFRATLKPDMEKRGIKVTPVAFLFKAAAAALRATPAFNASLSGDGESIVFKHYVHIGMAVDTPAGLMVPVVRDVDKKGIWELSEEIAELAAKARDRKLKPNDMQGGCFTISSLGGIGGTGFTPIVNAPEVGILGVSKLAIKPMYIDGDLQPRKMLPLSLSYDHRAVNGGDAGRFFTFLSAVLADVRRLVL